MVKRSRIKDPTWLIREAGDRGGGGGGGGAAFTGDGAAFADGEGGGGGGCAAFTPSGGSGLHGSIESVSTFVRLHRVLGCDVVVLLVSANWIFDRIIFGIFSSFDPLLFGALLLDALLFDDHLFGALLFSALVAPREVATGEFKDSFFVPNQICAIIFVSVFALAMGLFVTIGISIQTLNSYLMIFVVVLMTFVMVLMILVIVFMIFVMILIILVKVPMIFVILVGLFGVIDSFIRIVFIISTECRKSFQSFNGSRLIKR